MIEKSEARIEQAAKFGANEMLNPDTEEIGLFDKDRSLNNIVESGFRALLNSPEKLKILVRP